MNNMRTMIDRELSIADRLTVAQQRAAEARQRNFPAPCQCATCQQERALPGVLRVLAQHAARVAINKAMGEQNG